MRPGDGRFECGHGAHGIRERNPSVTLATLASVHVELDFEWHEVGQVTIDAGMLRFPTVGYVPGIYRIDLGARLYIGEADRLQRRFQNYRTPGGDPATLRPNTNRRVNRAIATRLAAGEANVAVCTAVEITVDGRRSTLDLRGKTARLLVESAAATAARLAGYSLENLAAEK